MRNLDAARHVFKPHRDAVADHLTSVPEAYFDLSEDGEEVLTAKSLTRFGLFLSKRLSKVVTIANALFLRLLHTGLRVTRFTTARRERMPAGPQLATTSYPGRDSTWTAVHSFVR